MQTAVIDPPQTSSADEALEAFLHSPAGDDYALVGGILFYMGSESFLHQEVLMYLQVALAEWVNAHQLGTVVRNMRLVMGPRDQPIPDLAFVRVPRHELAGLRSLKTVPAVVIEALSESTQVKDLELNRRRYAHYGIAEYFYLDPATLQVSRYRLGPDGQYGLPHITQGLLESQPLGCRARYTEGKWVVEADQ